MFLDTNRKLFPKGVNEQQTNIRYSLKVFLVDVELGQANEMAHVVK